MTRDYVYKCGNCFWFNGEVGDGVQFCDYKEIYVNENNCCGKCMEKENENDGE